MNQTFAIINILRGSPVPVYTVVCGQAYSAACVLASIGVKRYAALNSSFMIHDISLSGGWTVKSTDMQSEARECSRQHRALFDLMAGCCGQESNFFTDMLKANSNTDVYLTYTEARRIGLVTEDACVPVMTMRMVPEYTFASSVPAVPSIAGEDKEYRGTKKRKRKSEGAKHAEVSSSGSSGSSDSGA